MASFVRNIHAKNYRNLIICFQVRVENVGDVFLGHNVETKPLRARNLFLTLLSFKSAMV